MDASNQPFELLLRSAARRLKGHQRRLFLAEVATRLCDGNPRQAERRFGWGRATVAQGLREAAVGIRCVENFAARGRPRTEAKDPDLAAAIRAIVEPHTQADPELKSARRYTNLSAAEVRQALVETGYPEARLPKERALRDILNRLNYRLKRIQKGKPLKKTKDTDAIFANVRAAREDARGDAETLEISIDTKAKVAVGDYVRGGKSRTGRDGKAAQGWDHDPPAKEKLTPFGVLVLLTGALTLVFGSGSSSDFWVDALQVWWRGFRAQWRGIKRLVIYLDNGQENAGRRTQFLKRMVQFADWSGLVIRLVYYPPYHSKYNPIERCWSSLEKKWNGVLLNCWEVIRACALRMTWKGMHPTVERLLGPYATKVSVPAEEMETYNGRLERSATLPKYDITIQPKQPRGR